MKGTMSAFAPGPLSRRSKFEISRELLTRDIRPAPRTDLYTFPIYFVNVILLL
jgi:hypothetical protein